MRRVERLPIVGVMGSGRNEHAALSEPLGRALAALRVDLLTGGGRGVMTAVSRGFASAPERTGRIIGVLPCRAGDARCAARDGYPNPWVEIAIRTHLPDSGPRGTGMRSRNAINVLTSDLVVVLPGGAGTASEVQLAQRYDRPLIGLFGSQRPPATWRADTPAVATVREAMALVRHALDTMSG